jgi:transposase-like protein
MRCRSTKLVVAYALQYRKKAILHPLIKKHIAPGAAIFSDSAAVYVNTLANKSHLVEFNGYQHFYTNHASGHYVDSKFLFNNTMKIE